MTQDSLIMDALSPTVNLLVIRSSDMHRAVKFYQTIGLVFDLHAHGSGPEHYTSDVNGFVFEIYPQKNNSPDTKTRIGFAVDSVDKTVAALSALDMTVISNPADSPWGRRAVVRDLDGRVVELTIRTDSDANRLTSTNS